MENREWPICQDPRRLDFRQAESAVRECYSSQSSKFEGGRFDRHWEEVENSIVGRAVPRRCSLKDLNYPHTPIGGSNSKYWIHESNGVYHVKAHENWKLVKHLTNAIISVDRKYVSFLLLWYNVPVIIEDFPLILALMRYLNRMLNTCPKKKFVKLSCSI